MVNYTEAEKRQLEAGKQIMQKYLRNGTTGIDAAVDEMCQDVINRFPSFYKSTPSDTGGDS